MKHFFTAFACLMLACVSCTAADKTRTVSVNSSFNAISVSSVIDVVYTVAPKVEIKVKAPEAVLDKVVVDVVREGGMSNLQIGLKGDVRLTGKQSVTVYVKAPAVSGLIAAGASEIKVNSPYAVSKLSLVTMGDSEINLTALNATSVAANASGSSEIKLGDVIAEKVALSGAGASDIVLRSYQGNELAVNAGGSAEVKIKSLAATSLAVNASGDSEVKIEGRAAQVAFNASGSAEIDVADMPANVGAANASGASEIKCSVANLRSNASGTATIRNK